MNFGQDGRQGRGGSGRVRRRGRLTALCGGEGETKHEMLSSQLTATAPPPGGGDDK